MTGRRLVLLGPPGSGKGTQGNLLSARYGIPKISTGDLLRSMRDDAQLGSDIRRYQDSGGLVPDEVVLAVVERRLQNPDCTNGYIFDGFPRTLTQAESLDSMQQIDRAIYFRVPYEVIAVWTGSRITCRGCNAIYNTISIRPKVEGKCDKPECGGQLYQRDDDKPETVRRRFEVFQESARPLADYYRGRNILRDVIFERADVTPEEMFPRTVAAVES